MIEKKGKSSGNVVGYKAIGTITASDYQQLGSEVKALVEKEGSIRLLIDLCEFKWEKMEAWLPDLKFGSEFHDEIQKIAIVGDLTWEKWITHLSKPFFAHDAKFFHHADMDKAWAWLRE